LPSLRGDFLAKLGRVAVKSAQPRFAALGNGRQAFRSATNFERRMTVPTGWPRTFFDTYSQCF